MQRHQSITGEHSKIPELLYYLFSRSHHRHPGSFYSPTLHYWGVRYHACALPPSHSRLKTSASACTRCHCLWVKLWETVDLDATRECDITFKKPACGWKCVFMSVFPWWIWNQTRKSPQLTRELLSSVMCPIYFWYPWNFISSWNHSHLKSKAWHLKDPMSLIHLAGSQAVMLSSYLKPLSNMWVISRKLDGCQWLQHEWHCTQATI